MNNKDKIIVKSNNCLIGAGQLNTNINIKFLKLYQAQQSKIFINSNLNKILKLCLLKEISSKLRNEELNNLPKNVSDIMIVLKNGYIGNNNNKDFICDILNKTNGNNIMSFSKYVDEIIDINQLNNIINQFKPFCCCSSNDVYNEIN